MLMKIIQHSPVADPLMSFTFTVISIDGWLLRTSKGCAGLSPSSILYVGCSKFMVMAKSRHK